MAIKEIKVPFCDVCGEPWLPKFHQANGMPNPIFEHPEQSKRCGKCKSTRWNANGVDRRRKTQPQDTTETETPEVTIADVEQTIDRPLQSTARCQHGLYKCPQCSFKEAY
jgi:hypothetical protein